jgi:hypothetical protein
MSKIALLAVSMIFTIVVASIVFVADARSPSPVTAKESGSKTCQFVFTSGPTCTITVTFPAKFKGTPTVSVLITSLSGGSTTTQPLPSGNIVLQSDNGEVWANMPAATTEVYGTNNHEMSEDVTGQTEMTFSATCQVASSSATAVLRPQYSIDGGGSWHELSFSTTFLDININNCPDSFSGNPAESVGPWGIQANVSSVIPTIFRIVGINGGGAGDNPEFSNLELIMYSIFNVQVTVSSVTVTDGTSATVIFTENQRQASSLLNCNFQWTAELA